VQLEKSSRIGWGGGMWDVRGRGMVHTGFWWGNLREKDHFEDLGVDGRIILKRAFNRWVGVWTGLIWLRVGENYGLF